MAMDRLRANLAEKTVELRQRRGITQSQLAKLSGVPRSTIAYMESGKGNPTLETAVMVAAALQVPLEELLSPSRAECKLVPYRDLQRTRRGATLILRLLPDPVPGMVMDRMEIDAFARLAGIPHTEGTREYFTCLEGEVTVHVDGEKYRVTAGDVLAFPGDRNHSYANTGSRKAICLSVVVLAPPGL